MRADRSARRLATMRAKRAALGAASAVALVVTLGACSGGADDLKSWCDRGNRIYLYDGPERDTQLSVIEGAMDCPEGKGKEIRDESVWHGGDTRPMPSPTGLLNGPYRPWDAPNPNASPGPVESAPAPSSYRLRPIAG